MPLDRATLHTWLHHWQDEYDAAYLYLVLAGQEPDPKRKDVYIKLAGVKSGTYRCGTSSSPTTATASAGRALPSTRVSEPGSGAASGPTTCCPCCYARRGRR